MSSKNNFNKFKEAAINNENVVEDKPVVSEPVKVPTFKGTVNVPKLNVRKNPYASADVVGIISPEDKITVEKIDNPDWLKIVKGKYTGYVMSEYVNM